MKQLVKHKISVTIAVVVAVIAASVTIAFAEVLPNDTDGDGVIDEVDRCATIEGKDEHFGCPHPVVVEESIFRPERYRVVRVKRWRPWATPSYAQVHKILRAEQQRWGGPHLGNRVACESGYSWSATNGQYSGLLQFGSIWYSMWSGTPRKVKFVERKTVKAPIVRHRTWSNGNKTKRVIGKVKQRRKIIRKGKLPKNPSAFHGWAAIRVGQRAVSGHGLTTSWACGV